MQKFYDALVSFTERREIMMNIYQYWDEKTQKLREAKNAISLLGKEKVVRKKIICKIMQIPEDSISYYLKRDLWLRKFALDDMYSWSILRPSFLVPPAKHEKAKYLDS